ncbi:hypothetical protein, partial [Ralstonia pseudosolanacearum]|uniref:hypothetical protein n=1 Tax=Ralstonia pseudosolanacearum TaxID=1310165 RepID=UPI001E42F464
PESLTISAPNPGSKRDSAIVYNPPWNSTTADFCITRCRKRRANRQGFQSEFLGLARFDWAIGQGAERTVDGNQHVPASSVFNGDAGHIFSRFGNYIPIEQILVKREQ